MAFSLFKKSRAQRKVVAVFDIGSASVGGALVSVAGGTKAQVMRTVRTDMILQEELDFKRFTLALRDALKKTAAALAEGKPEIDECVCLLASPWYASEARTAVVEKEKQFVVTASKLRELIEKEVESFEGVLAEKYGGEQVSIIDAEALTVKLNGYPTPDPYGTFARKLEASVYVSITPTKIRDMVIDEVRNAFGQKNVRFHSFPLISFSAARDIFPEHRSFLYIDITGEVTDLSLVKDDAIRHNHSFPYGKNTLIRNIASAFQTAPSEAVSLFNLYREGKAAQHVRLQIKKVITDMQTEWSQVLDKELGAMPGGSSIPHAIFFTADRDVAPLVEEAIEARLAGMFEPGKAVDAIFLANEVLDPFVTYVPGVERDAFLSLAAIFLRKLESE